MKLSPQQKRAIEALRAGWYVYSGIGTTYYPELILQTERPPINLNTLKSLWDLGLVETRTRAMAPRWTDYRSRDAIWEGPMFVGIASMHEHALVAWDRDAADHVDMDKVIRCYVWNHTNWIDTDGTERHDGIGCVVDVPIGKTQNRWVLIADEKDPLKIRWTHSPQLRG